MQFYKYQGTGNDFIIVNDETFPLNDSKLISKLCDRHFGIGSDGLISLSQVDKNNFSVRIFNSDGFEANLCGNGLRCIGKFIKDQGFDGNRFNIRTKTQSVVIEYETEKIKITFPSPKFIKENLKINIDNQEYLIHFVDVGALHAVCFLEDIQSIDVNALGKKIRFSKSFLPHGSNVDFVQIDDSKIFVRTYERGVEQETLSCGTGAIASAFCSYLFHNLSDKIKVIFSGGEIFIHFELDHQNIKKVQMLGSAFFVFKTKVDVNSFL